MADFKWVGVGGFNRDMYINMKKVVVKKIEEEKISRKDAVKKLLKLSNALYGVITLYPVVLSETFFKYNYEIEEIDNNKHRINEVINTAQEILNKLSETFTAEEIMAVLEESIIIEYELNVSSALLTSLTYIIKPLTRRKVDLESNLTELLINYNISNKFEKLIIYLWIIEDLVKVVVEVCSNIQRIVLDLTTLKIKGGDVDGN